MGLIGNDDWSSNGISFADIIDDNRENCYLQLQGLIANQISISKL